MTSAQLGQMANQAFSDPALSDAQGAVTSAQGNYTQGMNDSATLPQMLSNSLNGSLGSTQDPQRNEDLATLLTGMNNPSGAVNDAETMALPQAELNKQPGIINAGAQGQAMAGKLGNAAARLSADNEMLGARGMGITGILGTFSSYMANHTQALLAAVQNAQSNRDYLFQKASTLGSMALNLAQLKQSAEQFQQNYGLQQQGLDVQKGQLSLDTKRLGVEQSENQFLQSQKAVQSAQTDAGKMSQADFYKKYAGSNVLGQQQATSIWNSAHPNQPANFGTQGILNKLMGGVGDAATGALGLGNWVGSLFGGGKAPLSSFDK